MDEKVLSAIRRQVQKEPYAHKLGITLLKVAPGYAMVEMTPQDDAMNIFGTTHGGAIFSLIDEAFEVSCNAHGTVAVALSMTITYHQPPDRKSALRAESREIHRSRKTATYEIKVTDEKKTLIASCTALAYRKKEKLPFLDEG
ncbi:MAG: hotdog fold thioesterase [Desulfobacteraceae bacterium]|jgi:acyl-CoA thioesterase